MPALAVLIAVVGLVSYKPPTDDAQLHSFSLIRLPDVRLINLDDGDIVLDPESGVTDAPARGLPTVVQLTVRTP